MIINHNMMSMNAQRSLGVNSSGLGKSIEKLSTGQRVNRAADDAAGLTISEKMRTQVRGLTQASRNAQDGISAVQTAEGALDEVHSMLQRMRELTVQAGNDTNQAEDRKAIQAEIKQLSNEIEDISTKTEFNKQKLLDGSFKDKSLQVGANEGQTMGVSIESMSASKLNLGEKKETAQTGVKTSYESTNNWTDLVAGDSTELEVSINGQTKKISMSFDKGEKSANDLKSKIEKAFGADNVTVTNTGGKIKIEAKNAEAGEANIKVKTGTASKGFGAAGDVAGTKVTGKDEWAAGDFVLGVSVKSAADVEKTLKTIDKAISQVSTQRSSLGAVQNRLEHTIKNLNNASENTQSAEARIRDTDMAKEMSTFTKNNVLSQAAQAMISQANQIPNQALQLLR
ncbi:flagellin [[Eubacterium] yurii]|nr:flagellin [[Eubacterium] yurii]